MENSTVYRVTFDGNQFQQLGYDLDEPGIGLYRFRGVPRGDEWEVQPVAIHSRKLRRPDVWHLAGAAVLVFEPAALSKLNPHVSAAGELLPLVLGPHGEKVFALNITRDVDCLNTGESLLGPVRWRLEFAEQLLPASGLFKVPQADAVLVLCLERSDDPDSFRKCFLANGMVGLEFEPVWSSLEGARPFSLLRI